MLRSQFPEITWAMCSAIFLHGVAVQDHGNGFPKWLRGGSTRQRVPLAELYHYSTSASLSLTQGRATHKQSFSHYEEAPREFADKVVQESAA